VNHPAVFGDPLSDRELEVLGLVAQGLPSAEIGARLFITEDTVKTHLRRISKRLGAVSRAHAVALGFDLKILVPGEPPIIAQPKSRYTKSPYFEENPDAR
jgi:DNA-binding CsgD family transcriptional regulator